jgi:hypothetical protein
VQPAFEVGETHGDRLDALLVREVLEALFLDLVRRDAVEPFLAAVRAKSRDEILAEIKRSEESPDTVASRARIKSMTAPPVYRDLEEEIETTRRDKEAAIEAQEFEKAANLRDKERQLTNKKRELEEQWRSGESGERPEIGEEEIADIVSMWTGIPVFKLTEAETQKLMRMEEELHKRVIGQDAAIEAVSKAIRRSRAGLKNPNRPVGSSTSTGRGRPFLTWVKARRSASGSAAANVTCSADLVMC